MVADETKQNKTIKKLKNHRFRNRILQWQLNTEIFFQHLHCVCNEVCLSIYIRVRESYGWEYNTQSHIKCCFFYKRTMNCIRIARVVICKCRVKNRRMMAFLKGVGNWTYNCFAKKRNKKYLIILKKLKFEIFCWVRISYLWKWKFNCSGWSSFFLSKLISDPLAFTQ